MKFDMKVWSLIALILLLVSANVAHYNYLHKHEVKTNLLDSDTYINTFIEFKDCDITKDKWECSIGNQTLIVTKSINIELREVKNG